MQINSLCTVLIPQGWNLRGCTSFFFVVATLLHYWQNKHILVGTHIGNGLTSSSAAFLFLSGHSCTFLLKVKATLDLSSSMSMLNYIEWSLICLNVVFISVFVQFQSTNTERGLWNPLTNTWFLATLINSTTAPPRHKTLNRMVWQQLTHSAVTCCLVGVFLLCWLRWTALTSSRHLVTPAGSDNPGNTSSRPTWNIQCLHSHPEHGCPRCLIEQMNGWIMA